MRRQFVADMLSQPPLEERIAPGGYSSSHVINRYLESFREELITQRDLLERAVTRAALHDLAVVDSGASIGALLTEITQRFQSLSSGAIPVSFRTLQDFSQLVQPDIPSSMMMSDFGVATAPVLSRSSLVSDGGALRPDLRVMVAAGSSPPGDDSWLYVLTPEDAQRDYWLVSVPAGAGGSYLRVRVGLAAGGFDELANLFRIQIFPPSCSLVSATLITSAGQTQQLDWSGFPWLGMRAPEIVLHWNAGTTGPVSAIDLQLKRVSSGTSVVCLRALDVVSVRFDRQGQFRLNLPAGVSLQRVDWWRIGSPGVRTTVEGSSVVARVERGGEWFAPIIRGVTLYR